MFLNIFTQFLIIKLKMIQANNILKCLGRLSILSALSQQVNINIREKIKQINQKQQKYQSIETRQNNDKIINGIKITKQQQFVSLQLNSCFQFIKLFYSENNQNWKIIFQDKNSLFDSINFSLLEQKHSHQKDIHLICNRKTTDEEQSQLTLQNKNRNSYTLRNYNFGTQLNKASLQQVNLIQYDKNKVLINPSVHFIKLFYKQQVSKRINGIYLTTSNMDCFLATIYSMLLANSIIQIITTRKIYSQFLKVVIFMAEACQAKQQYQRLYSSIFKIRFVNPKQYFKFHGFTAYLSPNLFPFQCYDLQILQNGKKILAISTENIQNIKAVYLKHKAGQISEQQYQRYVQQMERRQYYMCQQQQDQQTNLNKSSNNLLLFLSRRQILKPKQQFFQFQVKKYEIQKDLSIDNNKIIIRKSYQQPQLIKNKDSRISKFKLDQSQALNFEKKNSIFYNSSTLQLSENQKNYSFKLMRKMPQFISLSDKNIKDIMENSTKLQLTQGQTAHRADQQLSNLLIKIKGSFCLTKNSLMQNCQKKSKQLQNVSVFGWFYFLKINRDIQYQKEYQEYLSEEQYNFECSSSQATILKIDFTSLDFILSSQIPKIVNRLIRKQDFFQRINRLSVDYQVKQYMRQIIANLMFILLEKVKNVEPKVTCKNKQTQSFGSHCLYRQIIQVLLSQQNQIQIQKIQTRVHQNQQNQQKKKNDDFIMIQQFQIALKYKIFSILKHYYFGSLFGF